MSMLETIMPSHVPIANKVLTANGMLIIDEVNSVENSDESIEKYRILSKTRKTSKGQKLSKSGNLKDKKLAKSKKPLKSRNSPNFDTKKAGLSFLTPKTRAVLNCLWLAFIKTPILDILI